MFAEFPYFCFLFALVWRKLVWCQKPQLSRYKKITRTILAIFLGGMHFYCGFTTYLPRLYRGTLEDVLRNLKFVGYCLGVGLGLRLQICRRLSRAGSRVATPMFSAEMLRSVPERISGKIVPGTVPETWLLPRHLVPSLGAPWVGLLCACVR